MSDTLLGEQKLWSWMYVLVARSTSRSNYTGLSHSCC